jgi:hypothetical protein
MTRRSAIDELERMWKDTAPTSVFAKKDRKIMEGVRIAHS